MKFTHRIDQARCKGCDLCADVCPRKVLEPGSRINAKGHLPVFQARPEDCIHCALCCIMCPDVAIRIVDNETETSGIEPPINKDMASWQKS